MSETKVFYFSGPVNGADVYRKWQASTEIDYFGTSYLSQFFTVCRDLKLKNFVITSKQEKINGFCDDKTCIINVPYYYYSGLFFHFYTVAYVLYVLTIFLRSKSNVLVLTQNQHYWFVFAPLRLIGVKFIPCYHTLLWPNLQPRSFSNRILNRLNGPVIRNAEMILACTPLIERQLVECHGKIPSVVTFLPTYRAEDFDTIVAGQHEVPFTILYVGRMEADKGIFDLLSIAERLREWRRDFRIIVCGTGSREADFVSQINTRDLASHVEFQGFCGREKLSRCYQQSDIVVVPSRSELGEGYNMVCAEAVLFDRPLVTSKACPALRDVKPAAIEVIPDDVNDYAKAIVNLMDDKHLYNEERAACGGLKQKFSDPTNSYGEKLYAALSSLNG